VKHLFGIFVMICATSDKTHYFITKAHAASRTKRCCKTEKICSIRWCRHPQKLGDMPNLFVQESWNYQPVFSLTLNTIQIAGIQKL